MHKDNQIGIVGNGFVGNAVRYGFSSNVGVEYDVKVFDRDSSKSTHSLEEVVNESSFVFISVPTPSKKTGEIDTSIIDSCFSEISKVSSNENTVFLLRSTVIPGVTRKISSKHVNLRIVFNPEFLTERTAKFDFISQNRFVVGGKSSDTSDVARLYRGRFGKTVSILETDFESAEMIKYMTNIFLSTKVSFLNEMKILSDVCGAEWEDVLEGFLRDGRIGHSHSQVPGPDGKLGFGGSCFPKDIQAFLYFSKCLGVDLNTVKGAWTTNLQVRPDQDWLKLKGRAVSEE